jgi:hypothetical protein
MAELCLALERAGHAGQLQEAEAIFAALESEFACVRRVLEGKRTEKDESWDSLDVSQTRNRASFNRSNLVC